MGRSSSSTIITRVFLVIGWCALTAAVIVAHRAPATGYEVSLYSATPWPVWALLACSVLVSVVVAFGTTVAWTRRLACTLASAALLVFVGLPVIRGYRFISGGDALTHLGWARGIESGTFRPAELHYPGLHTASTMLASTVGIDLAHAMLVVIVILFGVFALFVTLSVRLVFERETATVVGAFSAVLVLPITNLSTYVTPHVMSQAILVSTIALFLLLKYVDRGNSAKVVTPVGGLLAITLVSLVLYHPQLAAHLLAVFVGIAAVQVLYRWQRPTHPIAAHRPIFGQTVLLLTAFAAWSTNHGFIRDVATFHIRSTIEYFVSDEGAAGDAVESQGDSLTAIGASIPEIVGKLLGPSLVFGALSAVLIGWLFIANDRRLVEETRGLLTYFVVALGSLGGLFGVYFFGSMGEMYFRVLGLIMVFLTILGAGALTLGFDRVGSFRGGRTLRPVFAVGIALLLVVSALALFPSPYIYAASPHVTEHTLEGHERVFEATDDDAPFDGIRSGPERYADATRADLELTRTYGSISEEELDEGIARQYDEPQYLTVDRQDHEREVTAYKELRYSETQLESIHLQPGVHRIQSNGEMDVYYVAGEAE